MFGLNKKELEYLKQSNEELKIAIESKNYIEVQDAMYIYLISEDCMDDDYIYTEKGVYVQILYDKIIEWYDETHPEEVI